MILTIYLGVRSSKLKIYTKFQTLAPNCMVLHRIMMSLLSKKFKVTLFVDSMQYYCEIFQAHR